MTEFVNVIKSYFNDENDFLDDLIIDENKKIIILTFKQSFDKINDRHNLFQAFHNSGLNANIKCITEYLVYVTELTNDEIWNDNNFSNPYEQYITIEKNELFNIIQSIDNLEGCYYFHTAKDNDENSNLKQDIIYEAKLIIDKLYKIIYQKELQ